MATLIIAEKPSSSLKIARALAEGDVEKKTAYSVAYYRLKRGGKELIVAPAAGHLFVLAEAGKKGWTYPVFGTEWKPVFTNKRSAWSRKYYQNIQKLAGQADSFISACDFDIEGSTIAWNIIRFLCKAKDGKRMKFSTLTTTELSDAYDNASPHLDFGQIDAGLTRHHLDFLWGINASRALTLSLKSTGGFKILSTGRVQGPTLAMLEKRERDIAAFIPIPYWELHTEGAVRGQIVHAVHIRGKLWEKKEAERIFKTCKGNDGIVDSIEQREYQQKPPAPFDLTTLQREAYQHFGFSPKQTLDVAQTLYEKALISYPRTSSQKLPAKLGFAAILKGLKKQKLYASLCEQLLKGKLMPHEGVKKDSAHPAIYPTGAVPKGLNTYQKKLYDMIVRRFLAVFAGPAVRERMKVAFLVNGELFAAEGFRTLAPNWISFYKPYATFREVLLPPLKKGETFVQKTLNILDKQTQPPSRFTQATVLKEMEKLGLGTKATRANILQTLYERGYIDNRSITVTQLGKAVIAALEQHCRQIVSVELTRNFEEGMAAICEGKQTKDDVIKNAEQSLRSILEEFKKSEKMIGETLMTGLKDVMRAESTIGPCACGKTLTVRRSRAGKRFVGCTGYPQCTETFSLPHTGRLKPLTSLCECGLFIVQVKRAGKRPWNLCVRCGFKNNFKQAKPKTV